MTAATEGLLLVAEVPENEIVSTTARFDVAHQIQKQAPLLLYVIGVRRRLGARAAAVPDQPSP